MIVEPGMYNQMSYTDYAAVDAISRRHLIIDRNWERTRYYLNVPREETEATILGRAVHAVELDAPSADRDFFFTEDYSRVTKEGKARWEADKELAGTRTIIRGTEAFGIAASVCRHPAAKEMLHGGNAEVSCFWKEGIDLCKARIDYLRDGLIVELKTTTSAAPRQFTKEIAKYGYHLQLAWYRLGVAKHTVVRGCAIIAVEKTLPYSVAVYYLTNEDMEKAEKLMMERLREFRTCRDTQYWTGYPNTPQELKLPEWAFGEAGETEELALDF